MNPADPPILTLSLTSKNLPMTQVNDLADTLLAQKLSQVSGVGRVLTEGGQRPAFRIALDPSRLATYGISMEDVRTALAAANVNLPKGSFDGPLQAVALDVNDQVEDIGTYRNLIIATHNGTIVRVGDVGTVEQSVENARVGGWVNGQDAVIVDIQRQPGANIVATVDKLKAALPQLLTSVPTGIDVKILADRTQTIRASVRDVEFTLVITIALVILVIYLFLRSARATIIPGVALPLSLIATFGIMSLCGFSLDNLSLMALTISAGFVVDDAIVMIENIVRYIEQGEKPLDAAFKGAKEIGFTVVSLTVSLIAVFIPLLFMTGIVGRLFREFALTLTIAVITSMVISLTLTPMMCGRNAQGRDIARGSARARLLRPAARPLRLQPAMGPGPRADDAAGRAGDVRRHHRALFRRAQGLPAAGGHRPAHRDDGTPPSPSPSPRWRSCRTRRRASPSRTRASRAWPRSSA